MLDTDSICLTTIADLDDIVRPEKLPSWPSAKEHWFVKPETGNIEVDSRDARWPDSRDARWPGKMKLEWSSSTGAIIW